jgi:hypothetical protein
MDGALDAYEGFWNQKLEKLGPILVSELRQTWKSAARREVRKRLREKDSSEKLRTPGSDD